MPSLCTPTDVTTYAVAPGALAGLTTPQIQAGCDMATSEAYSLVAPRYGIGTTFTSWDTIVTAKCAELAAWYAVKLRGVAPTPETNQLLKDAADAAREWFDGVGKRINHPVVTTSSASVSPLPNAWSKPKRGW